ncbi:hypothetical protein PybrP1_003211 [[Pythium] brassicae (nom. inval.)]|nr:hypothetical protein PybrP1_003211 [[Pythium] brassicae (nom. inval.)]
MHYEFIGALEVTYGNALAVGGGFHRVTTAEGSAAELAPLTYLWYKLAAGGSTSTTSSSLASINTGSNSSSAEDAAAARGITQLRVEAEDWTPPAASRHDSRAAWSRLEKPIDRQRGLFVWFESVEWLGPPSPSSSPSGSRSAAGGSDGSFPLKEIRVVRDANDVPEGFECLAEPIVSSAAVTGGSSKWSITTQRAGNWIEVRDASATKWSIAQILSVSPAEIRVSVATWRKGRDEFLSRASCRARVAKLHTHVNLYMSPSYPFTRKQGSVWHVALKDLEQARDDFDAFFFAGDTHSGYVPRHLIPFVEKSLLCMFAQSDLVDDMNAFHQHVLKNLVAKLLSVDVDSSNGDSDSAEGGAESDAASVVHLLALLRMLLNGSNACMYFYARYPGAYSPAKFQKLVYTSYLTSPDVLSMVPTRHPCRSFYFVDNVDLFIQAGGFRVILQRLARRDVALTELALFCALLHQAKPCLVQHKRRRSSASGKQRRATSSSVDAHVDDFFRDFLAAAFARLRRMSGDELKDDDGLVDHVVGMLEMLYRDGVLLSRAGGAVPESDADDYSSASDAASAAACDAVFAEAIEVFHLDLAKKYVCCPFLPQRLLGIARLNDLSAMAQRREELQKKSSLAMRRSSSASSGSSLLGGGGTSESGALAGASVAKWLRPKFVVEWLATSDVLEVITGDRDACATYELQEGTHLELLRRSKPIFEFVAAHGQLSEKHLLLLWRTGMSQLRSGRKAVFDMLIALCSVLSADLVDVVMTLLTQVGLGDYDELFVQFVRRVILIAAKHVVDIEAQGTKKTLSALVGVSASAKLSASAQKDVDVLNKVVTLGCCLLWNGILDGHDSERVAALRPAMRAEVESVLAAALNDVHKLWAAANSSSTSSKEQQKLLSEYLKKCVENIHDGRLVETSMSLIQRVADGYGSDSGAPSTTSALGLSLPRAPSFGSSSRAAASPSELLKDLNAKYELVVLVAEDVRRYMARRVASSSSGGADANDAPAHKRSIWRRLSFLGYIVTKSNVELSYTLVEQLWTCFSAPTTTPAEHEVFFEWFSSIVPDPNNFVHRAYAGNTAFASAVTAEIFQALVRKPRLSPGGDGERVAGIHLDVATMGTHAFWAFERLFRLVNTSERAIASTGGGQRALSLGGPSRDEAKGKFVVESFDLKGLEMLYEIALCAGSDDVSQEATNYLIFLHLHVGSKLVRREVWSDFVTGCFARLEKTATPAAATNDGDSDGDSAKHVHRLLVLLGTFLFQSVVQSDEASGAGDSSKDGPEELIVHVRTQDGRSVAPFRYRMRRTALIAELRDRIAQDTAHPADRVRIVNEFRTKLTAQGHNKCTLEKARVFSAAASSSASSTKAAVAPTTSAQLKRVNYVEAIMLAKVESDTFGHVQRAVHDVVGLVKGAIGAENDWHALKAEIAGSDRWLRLLFALLSQRVAVREEAWKVLKLLASDAAMEKRMRSLNDTLGIDGAIHKLAATAFDWDAMLDLSCSPKLLYQLELVERFAVPSDDVRPAALKRGGDAVAGTESDRHDEEPENESADGMLGTVNRWSASFLALGGKQHLEKFVLACSPSRLASEGTLTVMCLSKVLKLLRHFVLVEFRQAERDDDDDDAKARAGAAADVETLIHRLLETLESLKGRESVADASGNSDAVGSPSSEHQRGAELGVAAYPRAVLEDPDNIFELPSEAYLMTRTLSFITTSLLSASRAALPLLDGYPSHGAIVLDCLVRSPYKPVRQDAASLIAALSTTRNADEADRIACCHFFLELLSDFDGLVDDEEYFNVLTLLVSSVDTLDAFDILGSCRKLCRRVKAFSVRDDTVAVSASPDPASSPDALLEALLSTLLTIMKRIPDASSPESDRSLREVVASTLHDDEGIVEEIFHKCLFATAESARHAPEDAQAPSSQYYLQKPKCRSESSRDVAFALLRELSRENPSGLRYLLAQLSSQHALKAPSAGPSALATTEPPLSASKRKSVKAAKDVAAMRLQPLERAKYVGLKNLGCTCYLNSTIQSFFMIPRFRRQILRFHAAAAAPSESSASSSGDASTSVLYELQSLFAHLEGSAKPYYNPKPFTAALKTWDGESIDVNLQQDASEFLTSFFQQIESEMNGVRSGHGDENLLTTFFGGVFSNELVADGGRYSERAEPFHFISVPVRDRKNLKESLDAWVEGETVSYTWEKGSSSRRRSNSGGEDRDDDDDAPSADEKVTLDTHKRISIAKLPDQLIIHLKRFEFDFERMQQMKLHDRFEFPMALDMYPYTKAGQEEKRRRARSASSGATDDVTAADAPRSSATGASDSAARTTAPEYSQYELVGTVVHMGTANSGHYYSFLREQDTADSASRHWFEFNDTIVTPFDPQQIPDECFGGEDDLRRGFGLGRASSSSSLSASLSASPARMKTRSSFMLFYARKKPTLQLVRPPPSPTSGRPEAGGSSSASAASAAASAMALSSIAFATCGFVATFCAKLKRAASGRLESLRSVAQVIAPEPIRNLIAMENQLFWRKKYLYDARCLRFTHDIIQLCVAGVDVGDSSSRAVAAPPEARLTALQLATKFVFGTLWQTGSVTTVAAWKPALLALYRTDVDGCYWLLRTLRANEQLLLDLLVFSEHADVRELLASVLSEAIATTLSVEFDSAGPSGGASPKQKKKRLPASFEFVFMLVQLMPALLTVPVQHHRPYFVVVLDFAQTGRNEGAFLVVNSVVGAVVALLTGLGSTQPLLAAQLKRFKSRQILKSIDLSATVLKLLSLLVRGSLPPAMDAGKSCTLPPSMAHDPVELTAADHDVLLNERFLTLLTQRASRYSKETKPLEQLVAHLCWESRRVSGLLLDRVVGGIEAEDHHDVKPYFRTLNTMLKVRDSLAAERLSDGLTRLLAVMASQQRFYKATEISIDMLTRLAKRHASAARWLADNHASCVWLEKWLSGHRGADGLLQQKRTLLVKPNSTSTWANVSVTSAGLLKTIDRTVAKLLPRVRSLLDPLASMEPFYDSDDNPTRLVGKRIRVKWAKDKWYEGCVERFDEASYEHFVVYDDGDKRSYRMSEKQFYVVDSSGSGKVSAPGNGDGDSASAEGARKKR